MGHSKDYASRTLSGARAALNHCVKHQDLDRAPFIFDVESEADRRDKEPKERPLDLEEMAALFDAARSPHVWTFLMVLSNTLCRPDAAFDLTMKQVDLKHGLIKLNPTGRRQTKKVRSIIRLTATLRPWLEEIHEGPVIHYKGKPIKCIKSAWRKLQSDAGLDDRINPYSVRQTMARMLRGRRVPPEQLQGQLGRLPRGSAATTAIYAPYDPAHLEEAAAAIDAIMDELSGLVDRPLVPECCNATRKYDPRWAAILSG